MRLFQLLNLKKLELEYHDFAIPDKIKELKHYNQHTQPK